MNRMILIAAGLVAAAPAGATAVEGAGWDVALDLRGADGVPQQGRGGGGGKDDAGGRGQGGGNDARPSGERRQGGGQSTRTTERPQQPDRAESGRGRSSSSGSAETRRGNSGPGGSANAREERGGSSSSARGGSGNGSSASSRSERGNSDASSGRGASSGNAGSSARGGRHRLSAADLQSRVNELPSNLRRMAASTRPGERMVAGAVARGRARGVDANAFDVRSDGGRLSIFNRTGQLLLDLDDDRARDLGGWRLRRLGDRQPAGNAPAFCRSGAGHPVWGREWCLDKGFGLGSRSGTIWSRGGIDDVIWRRRTDDRLDRGGLIGVLGDIVLGRLAFQAITLGYDQPLVGYWVAQPEGPRILRVNSGEYEVAEFVDTNRDDRVDVLYVVQPVW